MERIGLREAAIRTIGVTFNKEVVEASIIEELTINEAAVVTTKEAVEVITKDSSISQNILTTRILNILPKRLVATYPLMPLPSPIPPAPKTTPFPSILKPQPNFNLFRKLLEAGLQTPQNQTKGKLARRKPYLQSGLP
jgi:hypothetical protein